MKEIKNASIHVHRIDLVLFYDQKGNDTHKHSKIQGQTIQFHETIQWFLRIAWFTRQ